MHYGFGFPELPRENWYALKGMAAICSFCPRIRGRRCGRCGLLASGVCEGCL